MVNIFLVYEIIKELLCWWTVWLLLTFTPLGLWWCGGWAVLFLSFLLSSYLFVLFTVLKSFWLLPLYPTDGLWPLLFDFRWKWAFSWRYEVHCPCKETITITVMTPFPPNSVDTFQMHHCRAHLRASFSAFCSLFNNWKSPTVDERLKEHSYYHCAQSKHFDMLSSILLWAWPGSFQVVSSWTKRNRCGQTNSRTVNGWRAQTQERRKSFALRRYETRTWLLFLTLKKYLISIYELCIFLKRTAINRTGRKVEMARRTLISRATN